MIPRQIPSGQLEALLRQVLAALEASSPHTPSPASLARHWDAWNEVDNALRKMTAPEVPQEPSNNR